MKAVIELSADEVLELIKKKIREENSTLIVDNIYLMHEYGDFVGAKVEVNLSRERY
jgi:hypothetical protein